MLPIISHMDGHTVLCFDYGYNVELEYESPEIVYFELECAENGFVEKFSLKSYDELIDNLVYYGYESTSFYIGIKSEDPIDKIAEIFNITFDIQLGINNDDKLDRTILKSGILVYYDLIQVFQLT